VGIRTPGLCNANAALYQLSYSPKRPAMGGMAELVYCAWR
jgi:hypothetical protein